MIYPEAKDKSTWGKRAWAFFTGSGSDHHRFEVPSPDKMRSKCLEIHLDAYKKLMLSGIFKGKFEICKAVEGFVSLFQCCLCQYYGSSEFSNNYPWEILRIKTVSDLRLFNRRIVQSISYCSNCRTWGIGCMLSSRSCWPRRLSSSLRRWPLQWC